jgi:hypothetical protein
MPSRILISVLIAFAGIVTKAQSIRFSAVDNYVQSIPFAPPDSLAIQLTRPFNTELEKTRAIFKWITDHIDYNVVNFRNRHINANRIVTDEPDDTSDVLKPLNERVALLVLHRKTAVCDGYSRLFKTLCDYAGLKAEIVRGYARTGWSTGNRFKSNHIWNAVQIDGKWHLLDATWAAGYVRSFANEFVRAFDETYFLTPPENFILDHYPEELKWTLMNKPPALREYDRMPFTYSAFNYYRIDSYFPSKGIIEAKVGDTLRFEIEGPEREKYLRIATSPVVDSNLFYQDEQWLYTPRPEGLVYTRKTRFDYVVDSYEDQWLYVIFNEEVILRYRLLLKRDSQTTIAGK